MAHGIAHSCGKLRYADKKAALSASNYRLHHRGGGNQRRGKTKSLRAYPCPDCCGWHLSSRQ